MKRALHLLGSVLVTALLVVAGGAATRQGGGQAVGAAAGVNDAFGDAVHLGSMAGKPLAQPVVGMAATATGNGYWLVARDGGIFSFGDARFHGSTGSLRLNKPIVGMTTTLTGGGYWFVASDGGVFSFGDARFQGSTGGMRLNQPIVAMAPTPTGQGYWLVARDGGIFSFGDARFHGSASGGAGEVSGIAATPTGGGYWVVGTDGRMRAFGDARELPAVTSAPGATVGVAATPDGSGLWAAGRTGGVRAYGSAARYGAAVSKDPVVGMAGTPSGRGYWLVTSRGEVLTRAAGTTTGAFGFLAKDRAGRPMRYDPCRPLRFVINPAGAPSGAVAEVRESFRRVGAVTGIEFVDAGTTTEGHTRIGTGRRNSYQPERYGTARWAPILVSWATAAAEPVLNGNVLGYGGSTSYWSSTSDQAYVTGEVVFDRDLSLVRPGFGAGLTRGNLVLHELSHVLGLDHVEDRGQVMYPSISDRSPDGFGPGDLAGLSQLGGANGCLRVASPVGGLL